jgi:hypothetical protein
MKELVTTIPDRFHPERDGLPIDDPRESLCEYIISPTELTDTWYDEGGCD